MNKKKSFIATAVVGTVAAASCATYYLASKKIFNDILVKGVASKASDGGTDYGPLNLKLAKSQVWFKKQNLESVSIQSFDNLKLQGYTLRHENNHKWVILAHGYKSSIKSMYYSAKTFYEEGYNILFFDQRSHGDSEGKYIGMGWLEQHDLERWINYVVSIDVDSSIVLYGVSMGGATVMMATGLELPNNVKCAIEDCGYTSLHDIFSDQAHKKYGLKNTKVFLGMYKIIKDKLGFNVHDASSLKQLNKSKTPTLFIHGDDDKFVPYTMVYHNLDACNAKKELFITPNLGHALSALDERYFPTIFNFINKYI